jgi:hypothetical protein
MLLRGGFLLWEEEEKGREKGREERKEKRWTYNHRKKHAICFFLELPIRSKMKSVEVESVIVKFCRNKISFLKKNCGGRGEERKGEERRRRETTFLVTFIWFDFEVG